MNKINKARYIQELVAIDPDTHQEIGISIYKHENGGMFGIDSSYVEFVLGNDDSEIDVICVDPLSDINNPTVVKLIEEE